MDKYKEMIDQAAAEYATANEGYRTAAATARDAQAELNSLNAELEEIQERIAEFEAGRVMIDAEEFIQLEDRRRYLGIRARQQATIAKAAAGKVDLAASYPRGVASKYQSQLDKMLQQDARSTAEARRAELAAVLRG